MQLETAARGRANAIRIEAEAEAGRTKIAAQGDADAALMRAKGAAEAAKVEAAGQKAAELLRSEGEAGGIRSIAEALLAPGGDNAMAQRMGNTYVNQLSSMAQNANLVIVPDRPNDVSSVLTTAMGLSSQISQGISSKAWPRSGHHLSGRLYGGRAAAVAVLVVSPCSDSRTPPTRACGRLRRAYPIELA